MISATICAMELWASRCRLPDLILVVVIDCKITHTHTYIYIYQIVRVRDFVPILHLKERAFVLCSFAIPQASSLGRSVHCQCCSPQWKRGAILTPWGDTCRMSNDSRILRSGPCHHMWRSSSYARWGRIFEVFSHLPASRTGS